MEEKEEINTRCNVETGLLPRDDNTRNRDIWRNKERKSWKEKKKRVYLNHYCLVQICMVYIYIGFNYIQTEIRYLPMPMHCKCIKYCHMGTNMYDQKKKRKRSRKKNWLSNWKQHFILLTSNISHSRQKTLSPKTCKLTTNTSKSRQMTQLFWADNFLQKYYKHW